MLLLLFYRHTHNYTILCSQLKYVLAIKESTNLRRLNSSKPIINTSYPCNSKANSKKAKTTTLILELKDEYADFQVSSDGFAASILWQIHHSRKENTTS